MILITPSIDISVRAVDTDGNEATDTSSFTVDTGVDMGEEDLELEDADPPQTE